VTENYDLMYSLLANDGSKAMNTQRNKAMWFACIPK